MTNQDFRLLILHISRQLGLSAAPTWNSDQGVFEVEITIPPRKHLFQWQIEGWRGPVEVERLFLERLSSMPYRRCHLCGEWHKRKVHKCAET